MPILINPDLIGNIGVITPSEIDSAQVTVGTEPSDQKKLRALIERRHPCYEENVEHWEFLEDTYEGGREWFEQNIFRYIKEGEKEYTDRVGRAYRFNHTREVVDLVNKYLFKQNIQRNETDAPASVVEFWKSATKNNVGIRDFARQISSKTSISGRIGIVIDRKSSGIAGASVADEKKAGAKTYAYIVGPEQLLDYSYDEDGMLNWALIEEHIRDDTDPINSSGDEGIRWRLWTKNEWILFVEIKEGRKKIIRVADSGQHSLGVVPVILADNMISNEPYEASAMIDDIAYLDRATANYLSNLDAIIQDQTFSQLAMPAQGVLPGEDAYSKLLEMGTKRIFLFDGERGNVPFYLSPDPKQAELILAAVNKIIAEIYHTVGLAGERTRQDNAVSTDNSSGVAKAFDFERVNALLSAKADSVELVENQMAYLVALWNGEQAQMTPNLVAYPDNFDTRGLFDELDMAARLLLVDAPSLVRQTQMKDLGEKLFPQLPQGLRKKMESEIDSSWPPVMASAGSSLQGNAAQSMLNNTGGQNAL